MSVGISAEEPDSTVLPATEAALVTFDGGTGLQFLMPVFGEDEQVPQLMVALAACGIRLLEDPEFLGELLRWLEFHQLETAGTA